MWYVHVSPDDKNNVISNTLTDGLYIVSLVHSLDVNEPPVNLTLSSTTVDENSPQGTPVGILSSDDPDGPSDVHTYSIVGPVGVLFSIGGDNNRALLVNGLLDHETNPTLLVIIRVTDKGGLFTQKTFKITVNGEFFMCKLL